MVHGRTMHGYQFVGGKREGIPTIYYDLKSGIGLTMDAMRQSNRRIGVIGLGAGTLAAYCKSGDLMRFYEINPQVTDLAEKYFTYLKHCRGKVEIVYGDARLSLEREPNQNFDLLVLDAYSGDAVPAHLLTREAFEIYKRHLRPGGVLAAHISNRYYSLQCVVEPVARAAGLKVKYVIYHGDLATSVWVLMTTDDRFFEDPVLAHALGRAPLPVADQLWTDEKYDLLSVMTPAAWGR
jgi:SAM-dependent methyltransferase